MFQSHSLCHAGCMENAIFPRRELPGNLVQIAGVIDDAEARMLIEAGVDWLGFPLRLAVHKEDLSEEEADLIIRSLPADHPGVLITYLNSARDIAAFCAQLGARHVQLHGDVSQAELRALKQIDPGLFVLKSIIVRDDDVDRLVDEASSLSSWVDAFITDTFDPATGATGATGRTHDWEVSAALVRALSRPVILAGGLNPDNVASAIETVHPAGVDSHTGVEGLDGRKDPEKVRRFVSEARQAWSRATA